MGYSAFFVIILFIFSCSPQKDNIDHFISSIEYSNEGAKILNQGGAFETLDNESMNKIIGFNKQALKEAKLVNVEYLNERLAGFGNHFNNEFIIGLDMFISGYETADHAKFLQGQFLLDNWGTWYANNISKIKAGK